MSLIRLSRSEPAEWIVRANSVCFSLRLPCGLSASSLDRISSELSGVRSSWLMLARNSDLYFEVSASCSAFSSTARRAMSISKFFASTCFFSFSSSCAFSCSSSLVACSSSCLVVSSVWRACSSWVSSCDCLSRPSVRIVAAIVLAIGLTVTDLSTATGISSGMLSKIENGNISPSLSSLQALSRALGIPLTTLFRGFEERRSASFVKSGEGLNIERRGTRAGHQYSLLGHIDDNSSGVLVEPYLITLTAEVGCLPDLSARRSRISVHDFRRSDLSPRQPALSDARRGQPAV